MPRLSQPVPRPTYGPDKTWASALVDWLEKYVVLIDQGPFDVHGEFQTLAGRRVNVREVAAAAVQVLLTDDVVHVKSPAVAPTVTLAPTPRKGRRYIIQDSGGNASVNNITIVPPGGLNLNGGAGGITISTNYGMRTIIFNGTQYIGS